MVLRWAGRRAGPRGPRGRAPRRPAMDPARFDALVRALRTPASRRVALRHLAGLAVLPALLDGAAAAATQKPHKVKCRHGATRCGKGCCAADDRCVHGTCYCGMAARARVAVGCTPMPSCADVGDGSVPCDCAAGTEGVLCGGPFASACQCVTTVEGAPACIPLDPQAYSCLQCVDDAGCLSGSVCVAPKQGTVCPTGGNACFPTRPLFC